MESVSCQILRHAVVGLRLSRFSKEFLTPFGVDMKGLAGRRQLLLLLRSNSSKCGRRPILE